MYSGSRPVRLRGDLLRFVELLLESTELRLGALQQRAVEEGVDESQVKRLILEVYSAAAKGGGFGPRTFENIDIDIFIYITQSARHLAAPPPLLPRTLLPGALPPQSWPS